ncbi:hypothetical protein Lalb_Chr02g0148661 [Lupinus albus]|uniref:Uncharacterized protein n=1 Tax=Lupinus albus TaxID=3870 RepID=A0A6A4QX93_LUPAL|nr:hypothetical protein Lalb_Chr02g0148661 [Lupinus albus]
MSITSVPLLKVQLPNIVDLHLEPCTVLSFLKPNPFPNVPSAISPRSKRIWFLHSQKSPTLDPISTTSQLPCQKFSFSIIPKALLYKYEGNTFTFVEKSIIFMSQVE